MLIGTIFGVLLIPGLYYVFAKMADGKSLIKDEHDEPISEEFFKNDDSESRLRTRLKEVNKLLKKMTTRNGNNKKKGKKDEE